MICPLDLTFECPYEDDGDDERYLCIDCEVFLK